MSKQYISYNFRVESQETASRSVVTRYGLRSSAVAKRPRDSPCR